MEKKEPGEYRLLHDLSFPEGHSVNDNISTEKGKTTYQTLDQVITTIVEVGSYSILSKFDVEHAYKILPIHPDDIPTMGFYWEGSYYFDKTLAMGCRTSAKIFERFTTALEWIMKNKFGLKHCHHVLDDFLLISKPQSVAKHQFDIFLAVCKYLNIPIKVTKTDSGLIIIYLGIELDTIQMQSRLPEEKIIKCIQKIDRVLGKERVFKKTLESLAGLLNFACRVIRPGRAFLRRIYTTIARHHHSKKTHQSYQKYKGGPYRVAHISEGIQWYNHVSRKPLVSPPGHCAFIHRRSSHWLRPRVRVKMALRPIPHKLEKAQYPLP